MKSVRTTYVIALCLCALLSPHARADVKLPGIFTSSAVLQRDVFVPVWGWADPGETVTITLDKEKHATTAGANGKWKLTLSPRAAGGPFTLTVAGRNTITLTDILFGDVWLCAGQSNMAWVVANSTDGKQAIAESDNPLLRVFVHPETGKPADEPATDCPGTWGAASPKTVPRASAVAYFFGRQLQHDLNVPIGLIYYSWGATAIESWTSKAALAADPEDFTAIIERNRQQVKDYPRALEEFKAKFAAAATQPSHPPVSGPHNPNGANVPFTLFNGLIHPLIPYAIRGVVWYQGESNTDRSEQYRRLLPVLINDWRAAWGQGEFPFLIVQISSVVYNNGWAELREAQLMTAQHVPNTGLVVTADIGANRIHPLNKKEVGYRLSLLARAKAYGEHLVYSGPIYDTMKTDHDKIRLAFTHTGSGLVSKDGKPLAEFEIAGEDRKFVAASAVIDGETVVVSSKNVPHPVAVRYAWSDNPQACNLFNKEGLPASPFRTDDWPGRTAGRR